MVVSHPDDEIIFGWPILQNKNINKKILLISSDIYNEKEFLNKNRLIPIIKICEETNTELFSLNYDNSFYRLEGWPKTLYKQLNYLISKKIKTIKHDYIFTHNPYGEYGHPDHRFCFESVLLYSEKPIIYTDIWSENPDNWIGESMSDKYKKLYFNDSLRIGEYNIDREFYKYCMQQYVINGTWTWGYGPIEKCNLYMI